MLELYRNIKKIREERGMSQDELAKLVGFKSRSSINKIEMGINDITQSKLVAIANALHVTPGELMGEDAEVEPQKSIEASPAQKEDREHKHLQNLLSDPHLRRILESSGQLSESSLQEVQNFIDFQLGKKKQ